MQGKSVIAGTEYFPTRKDAIQYYSAWGYDAKSIQKKINSKEIMICPPFIPAGKQLVIFDSRYWLVECNPLKFKQKIS